MFTVNTSEAKPAVQVGGEAHLHLQPSVAWAASAKARGRVLAWELARVQSQAWVRALALAQAPVWVLVPERVLVQELVRALVLAWAPVWDRALAQALVWVLVPERVLVRELGRALAWVPPRAG